jgi:hypothetical protein
MHFVAFIPMMTRRTDFWLPMSDTGLEQLRWVNRTIDLHKLLPRTSLVCRHTTEKSG